MKRTMRMLAVMKTMMTSTKMRLGVTAVLKLRLERVDTSRRHRTRSYPHHSSVKVGPRRCKPRLRTLLDASVKTISRITLKIVCSRVLNARLSAKMKCAN